MGSEPTRTWHTYWPFHGWYRMWRYGRVSTRNRDSPILAWIVFVWVSSAVLVWHCIRMWATFALAQNGVKMKVPNWNGTQIEIISITENYHRIRWLLLMGWSSSLATCGQWCLGMDMAVAAQLLVVWYCWVWLDDRVREDCGNCIMLLCK